MSFDDAVRPLRTSRYDGEDTTPTTPRELRGWYSYAIAAEVFAVVGVGKYTRICTSLQFDFDNNCFRRVAKCYTGLFLPVLLEQLPREQGVLFSDRSKPCVDPLGSGSAGRLRARADGAGGDDQCIVRFMGSDVTTTSFAMYTTSAAVLVQAITLVCFSSFADHGTSSQFPHMIFTDNECQDRIAKDFF